MKQKKNYYYFLLISFITVSCFDQVKKDDLPNEGSLTVIPINDITGIKFYDTSIHSASLIHSNEVADEISFGKKQKGNLFNVIIKKFPLVENGMEIDLIDAMKENDIKNYIITEGNKKDAALVVKFIKALKPPEPISLEPTGSISLSQLPDYPYFYIKINGDGSLQYKTDSADLEEGFTTVSGNDRSILSNAIANYIYIRDWQQKEFVIEGDINAKYKSFELVINALRKNNIYKYKLLTKEKKSGDLKLLMPKEEK
jgi:biopolymer transport protein ExbD